MQIEIRPVRRQCGSGLDISSIEPVPELRKHEVTTYFEPLELLYETLEVWLALDVRSYGAHAKVLVD